MVQTKEEKSEYNKEYRSRPEVKAKLKKYMKNYHKEYYTDNVERIKKDKKIYRKKNAKKIKKYQKEWYQKPENKEKQKEYEQKPEVKKKKKEYLSKPEVKKRIRNYQLKPEVKKAQKNLVDGLKLNIFQTYSKRHSNSDVPCCRCCGEKSHVAFLAIDHIQGKKQMDSIPKLVAIGYSSNLRQSALMNWIEKNNFLLDLETDYFQILCHNCNHAKGHSKDNTCPHERQ